MDMKITTARTDEINPDWSLPSFDETIFADRTHRFALIIPVINEGERIRAQLRRLAALASPVDVVIADGGSTDGSLDETFLRSVGVRVRLTKTGEGKLSAQLRMAYAWCLIEGYDGVVTVDGNNKDGVEAIPHFVKRLKEGYDYIQGSRYRAGGVAEHTPLDRTIGNRLVQAPILSFAGLRWYTDTTNGFRAYSRRFLLDPAVAPFRPVFQTYQLLSYLTVRAGQLGYRTCEIPVARRYPENEPIPTKITGWSSRLILFRETLQAAAGRFHPQTGKVGRITPKISDALIAFLIITPLFLLGAKYSFPYGNHGQELPPILRLVDPTLFNGDFAVEDFLRAGPRWFYNYLVAGFLVIGLSPATAYLFLYVLALGSTATALLVLGRRLTNDFSAHLSIAGILIVTLVLLPETRWASAFFARVAIPSAFAMGIAAWGITAAAAQRWTLAYTLFGAAALMQFLVGFLPGLLLSGAFLVTTYGTRQYLTAARALLFWGAGLAAIYLPMAFNQPTDTALVGGTLDPMRLFGFVRVPHHWLPSTAPVWHWPNIAAFYIAGLILAFGTFQRLTVRSWAPALASIIVIGSVALLANYLLVEVLFIDLVGKLQFQRIMPFVRLAVLTVVCGSVVVLWRENRKPLATAMALTPVFELFGFALLALTVCGGETRNAKTGKARSKFGIVHVLVILLPIGIASFCLTPGLTIDRLFLALILSVPIIYLCRTVSEHGPCWNPWRPILGIGGASIALVVLLIGQYLIPLIPAAVGEKFTRIWNYDAPARSAPERLAAAARHLSNPSEQFIVPPSWQFEMFSYYSKRPVYFSWKNVPYSEAGVVTWGNRLIDLTGQTPRLGDRAITFEQLYAKLSATALSNLAKKNGIKFIVSKKAWHDFPNATVIHSEGEWLLWELDTK